MIKLFWVLAFFACPPVTILVYLLQRRQQRLLLQAQQVQQVTPAEFINRAKTKT